MSLHNAVDAIADALEETAKKLQEDDPLDTIRMLFVSFSAQLRAARLAVGEEEKPKPLDVNDLVNKVVAGVLAAQQTFGNPLQGQRILTPETQHRSMIEKYRDEIREERAKADFQEKSGDGAVMVEVLGGPAADGNAPTFIPLPEKPPEGGYTSLAGAKYQVRNGKLQFIPE